MKKVGMSKLDVMQITVIQHALGVVDDGRQIDRIDFPAPCGEARQKETRPRSSIEGALTLPDGIRLKATSTLLRITLRAKKLLLKDAFAQPTRYSGARLGRNTCSR